MKLYLIRHGQVYNPDQIVYGRLPRFGLSDRGRIQIRATAGQLRSKGIIVVYSSPLLRARQTAAIISNTLKIKSHISSFLTESGVLPQGKPLAYFKTIEPDLYAGRFIAQGQESIEEILKRMKKFVTLVQVRYGNDSVAAVSHGDPILIFKAWYEDKPFTYEYKVANMVPVGGFIQMQL